MRKQIIQLTESQLNKIVKECVERLIQETVPKKGCQKMVFNLGVKLGTWVLINEGLDYCILRPVSENHIMKDGSHWNSTITSIPVEMFDEPRTKLRKYIEKAIMKDYNDTQNFYKNHKPSKKHDDWEDDEFWSGGWG